VGLSANRLVKMFPCRLTPLSGVLVAQIALCLPLWLYVYGIGLNALKIGVMVALLLTALEALVLSRLSDWAPRTSRGATTFYEGLLVGRKLAAVVYFFAFIKLISPWARQFLPDDPVPLSEQ
jgi:hypothetical protein